MGLIPGGKRILRVFAGFRGLAAKYDVTNSFNRVSVALVNDDPVEYKEALRRLINVMDEFIGDAERAIEFSEKLDRGNFLLFFKSKEQKKYEHSHAKFNSLISFRKRLLKMQRGEV